MQARLFISSALLLCSISKPSYACGPDAPVQPAPIPDIAVIPGNNVNHLQLNGEIAKKLFNHLTGPFVKVKKHRTTERRVGQGITCVGNTRTEQYSCRETVMNTYNDPILKSVRGDVVRNFEGTQAMKQNPNWIQLQLFGPELETLYKLYGDTLIDQEPMNGVTKYTKIGRALSCVYIDDYEFGIKTFACTQYLSSDGFPIGDGNDPIIGSGTHPLEAAGEGEMP